MKRTIMWSPIITGAGSVIALGYIWLSGAPKFLLVNILLCCGVIGGVIATIYAFEKDE